MELLLLPPSSSAMGKEEPQAMDLDPGIELKKEEQPRFFPDGCSPEYLRIYYGERSNWSPGGYGILDVTLHIVFVMAHSGFFRHGFSVGALRIMHFAVEIIIDL